MLKKRFLLRSNRALADAAVQKFQGQRLLSSTQSGPGTRNKEPNNAARLFQLNPDNTISPVRAAHLVFGMRGALPVRAAGALKKLLQGRLQTS